jgi:hypothetical protein
MAGLAGFPWRTITPIDDIRSTTPVPRRRTPAFDLRCLDGMGLGAAYRNRTDDLRITRGTRRACARASCTDSTGHRTDGTRGAGIIRRPGPRTGPRRDPASSILLLCVNVADDMDPRPLADRAPGPTVDLYAATHTVRLATPGSAELRASSTRILMSRLISPLFLVRIAQWAIQRLRALP